MMMWRPLRRSGRTSSSLKRKARSLKTSGTSPRSGRSGRPSGSRVTPPLDEDIETLNPAFNMVHVLFQLILIIVTINYLLGCLYDDRKDRQYSCSGSRCPCRSGRKYCANLGSPACSRRWLILRFPIVTQLFVAVLAMLMVVAPGCGIAQCGARKHPICGSVWRTDRCVLHLGAVDCAFVRMVLARVRCCEAVSIHAGLWRAHRGCAWWKKYSLAQIFC